MSYFNEEHYPDPTAYQAILNIENEVRSYKAMVYICSPYAGDVERNIRNAQRYSRFAVSRGVIPLAHHLLFTQFLDDKVMMERELGMQFGRVLMARCGEVWVFGDDITRGMAAEIKLAKWMNRRIRYFDDDLREVSRV